MLSLREQASRNRLLRQGISIGYEGWKKRVKDVLRISANFVVAIDSISLFPLICLDFVDKVHEAA